MSKKSRKAKRRRKNGGGGEIRPGYFRCEGCGEWHPNEKAVVEQGVFAFFLRDDSKNEKRIVGLCREWLGEQREEWLLMDEKEMPIGSFASLADVRGYLLSDGWQIQRILGIGCLPGS